MRTENRFKLKSAVAGALALMAASSFAGELTLYQGAGFQGRTMTTTDALPDIGRSAFSDFASSIVVTEGTWEACTDRQFRGRCAELVPGNYSNLSGTLGGIVASVRQVRPDPGPVRVVVTPDVPMVATDTTPPPVVVTAISAPVDMSSPRLGATPPLLLETFPPPTDAFIVLYQHTPRGTRAIELAGNVDDLESRRFDNGADAAFVGSGIWRLCDAERGRGHCTDFSPGRYDKLGPLEHHVKSAYLVAPTTDRIARVEPAEPGRAVLFQYPNYGGPSATVERGQAADLDWAHFKKSRDVGASRVRVVARVFRDGLPGRVPRARTRRLPGAERHTRSRHPVGAASVASRIRLCRPLPPPLTGG